MQEQLGPLITNYMQDVASTRTNVSTPAPYELVAGVEYSTGLGVA